MTETLSTWAKSVLKQCFPPLPDDDLREYKRDMMAVFDAHEPKLAEIQAEEMYSAGFWTCLRGLYGTLYAAHLAADPGAKIPAEQAAFIALNQHKLARVVYFMTMKPHSLRDLDEGAPLAGFGAPHVLQEDAALTALCGCTPGYNWQIQALEQRRNAIRGLVLSLCQTVVVLCICLKYQATGGPDATMPFVSLYHALAEPFRHASHSQRGKCLNLLRLHLKELIDSSTANIDHTLSKPAQYLALLDFPQASLSKPEISRRAARMYFSGGTKEGWEKAARRRFM
ncbi:hypothetical protein JCM11641_002077 [Rhodosporidiobolus odoratus]